MFETRHKLQQEKVEATHPTDHPAAISAAIAGFAGNTNPPANAVPTNPVHNDQQPAVTAVQHHNDLRLPLHG